MTRGSRVRNIVEPFFCRCKDWRLIAIPFDKLGSFLAVLQLFDTSGSSIDSKN